MAPETTGGTDRMESSGAGYMMLIMVFGLPVLVLAVISYVESIPEQLSEWRIQAKEERIRLHGTDD